MKIQVYITLPNNSSGFPEAPADNPEQLNSDGGGD